MTQFITRNKNCVYLLCLLLLLALPFIILVAVQSDSTATSKMFQVKLVVKNDKHPASKGRALDIIMVANLPGGHQMSNSPVVAPRAQPSNQINSQKRRICLPVACVNLVPTIQVIKVKVDGQVVDVPKILHVISSNAPSSAPSRQHDT